MFETYFWPLLAAFGVTTATLLPALIYLIKLFTEHALTKSLEAHKQKLSDESARELEKVRSALEKDLLVHNVKFTGLHQKRAEVMQNVYAKIVVIVKITQRHISPLEIPVVQWAKDKSFSEFRDSLDDFMLYYLSNRIFLMKRTCELIDGFRRSTELAIHRYQHLVSVSDDSPNQVAYFSPAQIEELDTGIKEHQNKAHRTLTALEDDMRQILGDEQSQ